MEAALVVYLRGAIFLMQDAAMALASTWWSTSSSHCWDMVLGALQHLCLAEMAFLGGEWCYYLRLDSHKFTHNPCPHAPYSSRRLGVFEARSLPTTHAGLPHTSTESAAVTT
eukprot:2255780-Amphidinium_carterae.1